MHVGLVVFNDVDYGLDLASALHETGTCVTLYLSYKHVTRYMGTPDKPIERLYEVGLLPLDCKVHIFPLPRMRDPRSIIIINRIAQTLRDDKVDILHILVGPGELWPAVLCLFVRNTAIASTMIIPKPNIGDDLPTFVIRAIYRILAIGSNVVIVNGENQVDLIQELYKVSIDRIAYVPLGPRTTAAKWSVQKIPEEPSTVLFFGEARRHKGLEYLVKAQPMVTDRVPHARILIASRGEELDRCLRMIQDSSKFEIHEGFVPGDLMAKFFQRASLVVLPYLSASTSGILTTAYVFGKPVVATSVGCLPEYVEDGVTGFLVTPKDVEQLAEAIVHLLDNNDLRHSMGENATCWVEERQKSVAIQTLNAYEKAICIHKGRKGHRSSGLN